MKTPSLLIIALCTCVAFSCERDTGSEIVWGRHVEARLTSTLHWEPCQKEPLREYKVVENVRCGAVEIIPSFAACDQISETSTHQQVLNALNFEPQCTSEAIDALERFALVNPQAGSDLAAAYYVRAQREDQPTDFLHALNAADKALKRAPDLRAARFNRALILEALSLNEAAIAAWDDFLRLADPQWDEEARRHRMRLTQITSDAGRWHQALADRNLSPEQLIAPFPSAAQSYFEEELLPQLRVVPLEDLAQFAAALSARMKGDPFATEVVDAIERATPSQREALQKAHATFAQARRYELALNFKPAAASYRIAADVFREAGSPFRLRAELGYATARSYEPQGRSEILEWLPGILDEAVRQDYRHLSARIRRLYAYALDQTNYLRSLSEYDAALAQHLALGDLEGVVAAHTRRAGVHQASGMAEAAWRHAFYATRHAGRLIDLKDRNALLLEAAAEAAALGYPNAAILYHDANVALLEREVARIVRSQPEETQLLERMTLYLAIAFANRAPIQVALKRVPQAKADLEESMRRIRTVKNIDEDTQRILEIRIAETNARMLQEKDPEKAIAEYSNAFGKVTDDFPSRRVLLLTQIAAVRLDNGQEKRADEDLRQAVEILRTEEQSLLAQRKPGEGEELWSPYFARFRPTHELLISRMIRKGQIEEAFAHLEQTRAVEPLDLLRKFGPTPKAGIEEIQKSLQPGTFIIEYYVLENTTHVWIIGAHEFRHIALPVDRAKTNRWSSDLQSSVRGRVDLNVLDAILRAAYDQLIRPVLAEIARMPNGATPERLVFIPDGGIHGLPLAALRNGTNEFLIERAAIEIAGSATLYQSSLQRDLSMARAGQPSILVIGDPAFDPHQPFARGMRRLPYARSEAIRIAGQFAPHSELLLEEQATDSKFLERAGHHDIVHIAAHAIVNAASPSRSMLLLARSPGRTGAIDAQRLLNALKLDRTRLVTLAACSSAGGLAVGPEGVAPLVRPLIAAGVPAVIGSLWPVGDATTEELMVSFYRHYETSSDAAVAMRKAQLELLGKTTNKDTALRSVLTWAPFQVIGHASSPYAARAPNGGTPSGIHASNSVQRPDGLRPQ